MKVYADAPSRFYLQLVADALFVGWLVLWIWLGHVAHDGTLALAEPGERAARSADSLSGSLDDAGDTLSDVPLIGDGVSGPFDKAADASDSLADAGRSEARAVGEFATWLGLGVAVLPIAYVGFRYLPGRVRFVRDATAAQALIDGPADLEIFALRAITHQPLPVLTRISDDPVGAWRRGDTATIARLAAVELRASGLRLPDLHGSSTPAAADGTASR